MSFTDLYIWFITIVLEQRAVMVVDNAGKQKVRMLRYTDGGKAYVLVGRDCIGFLDNAKTQNEGEFRKGVSSDRLVRWFNVS